MGTVRLLRRRLWLVLLLAAITTGAAVAISATSQKQYDATAELLLRTEEPVTGLLTPRNAGFEDPERELQTATELIKAGSTVHEVRRRLRLDRTADDLLEQIETETSADSDLVQLRARDPDARTAANIANAFADAFVRFRLDQAQRRYRVAADLAQQQLLALSEEDRRGETGITLQRRRDELRITAALQTGGAQVVRRASVPTDPSRPRPVLSGILGLLGGLVLGLAAAVALELFDRRIKDEDSAEELFGLPILATIPRTTRRAQAGGSRAERESYGLLAANLRFSGPGRDSMVALVTSGSPAEGKTSVTLGIARALAGMGLTVVAIEADLRRPAFDKRAHLGPNGTGLHRVLAGQLELHDALLEIDADHLAPSSKRARGQGTFFVLPAGVLPSAPQRVLSGPAMAELIDHARRLADIVLIDTAPIGTVNDAVPLLRHVDSVLVVARLQRTTKEGARRAMRVLRGVDAPLAGLVLTNGPAVGGDGYYSPVRGSQDTAATASGGAQDV